MRDDERENIFTVGTGRQKAVSSSRRDRRMAAEESGRSRGRDRGRKTAGKRKRGCGGALLSFLCGVLVIVSAFFAGMGAGWYRWGRDAGPRVDLSSIEMPDWIEQNLIRKNIYSRPAVSLREVNDIVVHYVANPGSTAEQNRNYFDNLADQGQEGGTSASAHFVIGLDGEIIQCVPIDEIAYASNNRNYDTISIEEVIEKQLAVVDLTASIMCMEHKMPMAVFDLNEKDSIANAMTGKINGTVVTV